MSPLSNRGNATATAACVSMSTACSALYAKCVRVSSIFVMARGRLDSGSLCQLRQKRLVHLACVPPYNAPHRRLQRRRVHGDGLALHQYFFGQRRKNPRMRLLCSGVATSATRSNSPASIRLGNACEVSHEQHLEVPPGRDAWTPHLLGIVRCALGFGECAAIVGLQYAFEPLVERMARCHRQRGCGNPEVALPIAIRLCLRQKLCEMKDIELSLTMQISYFCHGGPDVFGNGPDPEPPPADSCPVQSRLV